MKPSKKQLNHKCLIGLVQCSYSTEYLYQHSGIKMHDIDDSKWKWRFAIKAYRLAVYGENYNCCQRIIIILTNLRGVATNVAPKDGSLSQCSSIWLVTSQIIPYELFLCQRFLLTQHTHSDSINCSFLTRATLYVSTFVLSKLCAVFNVTCRLAIRYNVWVWC